MFLLTIIYFLLLIFLAGFGILYFSYLLGGIPGRAPFVPANQKSVEEAVNELNLKEGGVVYDLGCGDGRVLLECYKRQPKAKYIGLERSLLPFLLAIFRVWRAGARGSIKIKKCNFFEEDLSNATHVYAYLFPEVMDELLPKLEKELKTGTVLVSPSFPFFNKKYEKKVDIFNVGGGLIKALFIYRF